MKFDWDAGNVEHIGKHGVTSEEAEEALRIQPLHVSTEERGGEARLFALGRTAARRVVAVIFTFRGRAIRVVTARDASRKERKQYVGTLDDSERG